MSSVIDARLRGLDLGERLQAALDLAERDALAVDLHQVVLASGDGQASVLVELSEVAGAEPAVRADAADRDAVVALGQVDLRHRQQRQRLGARPDRADVARRQPVALGPGDAHLDAVERAADGLGLLARAIDRQRTRLRAVVAGEQADAEAFVEAVGDARGQRRARAQEAGARRLERLDGRDAHQRAVERGVAREEVDGLLAQQLGDPLRRNLVLQEQGGAVRERHQQAEVEAVARVQRHRAQHAIVVGHAQRLADRLRGRAQVGGGLDDALGIAAHRRGELHDRGRVAPLVDEVGQRGPLVQAARQQRSLQPPADLGRELGRGSCRRPRHRRCRVVGEPRRRLHALAAARTRHQRAQRGGLQDHLQLAVAGRRIERDDHPFDLRDREGQDDEVGDVAEHEPDPGARADAHRVQLLRAPIDAMEQPAPRQVRVAIYERLGTAAVIRDAGEPLVKLHAADVSPSEALDSLYADGQQPQDRMGCSAISLPGGVERGAAGVPWRRRIPRRCGGRRRSP